jgi:thiamine kinase
VTYSPADPIPLVLTSGHVAADAAWTRLDGGRTNHVWLIDQGDQALVCKVYAHGDGNPLYPNLAEDEYAALTALRGTGLAPDPVAHLHGHAQEIVLYRHVAGRAWSGDPAPVAALLGRVHAVAPASNMRLLPSGDAALRRQVRDILAACSDWSESGLPGDVPSEDVPPIARPTLIHTDVVAGNIVVADDRLCLIDWQCPARGDPAEDLASFLSPAMQVLYGLAPLPAPAVRRFLDAYPDPAVTVRYRRLAPLFHWRIAAYCQWKVERGATDYAAARDLELAALARLQA